MRRPIGALSRWERRFGETFMLRLPATGPVLVTSSPALVEAMLTGPREVFRAGEATGRMLPLLSPRSILRLDGDRHHDRRGLLLPTLTGPTLQARDDEIDEVVDRHVRSWPVDHPFAVRPRAQSLAFEVAGRVLLGLRDPDAIERLESLVHHLTAPPVGPAVLLPALRRPARGVGPTAVYRRRARLLDLAIEEALATTPQPAPARAVSGDRDAVVTMRTLLLVGMETTSAAMAWTLGLLARNPRAADAIAEADDARLTTAAVQECLRLRPPVFDVVRTVARETVVDGRLLARGTMLLAASPLVHKRPDHYPHPERFDLHRFAEQRPDPMRWIAFGGGVRRCLGAALAQAQLESLVMAVLRRGRPAPAGPEEPPRLVGTTLLPAKGGRIVLRAHR